MEILHKYFYWSKLQHDVSLDIIQILKLYKTSNITQGHLLMFSKPYIIFCVKSCVILYIKMIIFMFSSLCISLSIYRTSIHLSIHIYLSMYVS